MIKLNIDHIILDGFNMTQSRAEHIKALLQTELQHRLSQKSSLTGLTRRDLPQVMSQRFTMDEFYSNRRIATSLADRIIASITARNKKDS